MATFASVGGKSDSIMAHATILAAEDGVHGDRIGSGPGEEDLIMTIATGQPEGVGAMRKAHIRHLPGVCHDNIQIKDLHLICAIAISARQDQTLV